jgi:acetyl esterase/lipase
MRPTPFLLIALLLCAALTAGCVAPAPPPALPTETSAPTTTAPALTATTPPPPTATATPEPPKEIIRDGYRIIQDVVYGTGGDTVLKLDVYIPDQTVACPTPAVVFIHGGGWRQGDKYPSRVNMLAQAGFVCVGINYRLSDVAPFPAAVEDAKCAVRWLRAHAEEYNVNPERIGVWGGSAGGHLSLMVGLADGSLGLEGSGGWGAYSSRVQAACSYYGPTELVRLAQRDNAARAFLGGTPEDLPEAYRLASPVNLVTADDPPVLMVHGDGDPTVPLEQSELLLAAYQAKGLDATLVVVENAGHGFKPLDGQQISPSLTEINQHVLEFFIRNLVDIHPG